MGLDGAGQRNFYKTATYLSKVGKCPFLSRMDPKGSWYKFDFTLRTAWHLSQHHEHACQPCAHQATLPALEAQTRTPFLLGYQFLT